MTSFSFSYDSWYVYIVIKRLYVGLFKQKSVYPGKPTWHALAGPGRYFTQSAYVGFLAGNDSYNDLIANKNTYIFISDFK